MREDYRLLTPENVELEFDVAGLGSRLAASLIDYTIIFVGSFVLFFGALFLGGVVGGGYQQWFGSSPKIEIAVGIAIVALGVLILFAGWWGYFILFELVWAGQSPGKRGLGLRVVRRDGQPLD